jgi:hypothetical protein
LALFLDLTNGAIQDLFDFSPSFLPSGFCNIGCPRKIFRKRVQRHGDSGSAANPHQVIRRLNHLRLPAKAAPTLGFNVKRMA